MVKSLKKHPEAASIYPQMYKVIRQCAYYIKQGQFEETFKIYRQMIVFLAEKYCSEHKVDDLVIQAFGPASDIMREL